MTWRGHVSNVAVFADNTKLCRPINVILDVSLHGDMDKLVDWMGM